MSASRGTPSQATSTRNKSGLPTTRSGFAPGRGRNFSARPYVVNLGEVKISFLVDAHSVDSPERTGPIASAAPLVEKMAVHIELDDLGSSAVGDPEEAIGLTL